MRYYQAYVTYYRIWLGELSSRLKHITVSININKILYNNIIY